MDMVEFYKPDTFYVFGFGKDPNEWILDEEGFVLIFETPEKAAQDPGMTNKKNNYKIYKVVVTENPSN